MTDDSPAGDGDGLPTGDGDGPPDRGLDPARSPGVGPDVDPEDVSVDRDVELGSASPRDLTAGDTAPVAADDADALCRQVREGDAVDRRRAAIELGRRAASQPVVDALATAVRTDQDADVRQFAVEALGSLGDERGAPATAVALDDEDPWVRAEGVVARSRIDPPAGWAPIRRALDDDHHAVRRNALVALFKREGEAALSSLLAHVDDDSERVREWVAHLLGGVDDDRARAALADLADDPVDVVVRTAVAARDADPATFRAEFGVDAGGPPGVRASDPSEREHPPDL